MGIVSLSKDMVVDFIPEYGGNRLSEDPSVVGIKPMSHLAVQLNTKLIAEKLKNTPGDAKSITEVSHEVQRKQFMDHVTYITNMTLDEGNGNIKELGKNSIAEFYDSADDLLIDEIFKAMESHTKLTEGQVKNSEGVSDTTSELETPPHQTSAATLVTKDSE